MPRRPVLVSLAATLALALAACAHRAEEPASDADVEPQVPRAASTPAPVAMTPARFDAYILALQNIRAAHPQFVEIGANPVEVREEMREAVSRAGLTLEEFQALHRRVEADPALKAETEQRLASARRAIDSQSGARPEASPTPLPPRTAPTPNP